MINEYIFTIDSKIPSLMQGHPFQELCCGWQSILQQVLKLDVYVLNPERNEKDLLALYLE